MSMEWKNIDLEKGVVFYPITKGKPLELPLSDFLIDLLRKRRACEETIAAPIDRQLPKHKKLGRA